MLVEVTVIGVDAQVIAEEKVLANGWIISTEDMHVDISGGRAHHSMPWLPDS